MSKKLIGGVLTVILAVFAGGAWLSCAEAGMEQCPYCKKSFPISNVRFHVRKCPKYPTDQNPNKPGSGKTTILK